MARLVWAVLCEKVIQDKSSNLLSLINVLERLNVAATESEISAAKEDPDQMLAVPVDINVAAWWTRSDADEEEGFEVLLLVVAPDGSIVIRHSLAVDLAELSSKRTIFKIEALPIGHGAGEYQFELQVVVPEPHGSGQAETVARLPLDLKLAASA